MGRIHLSFKGYHKKHFCLSENAMKNMILCVVGMACACLLANLTRSTLFQNASDVLKDITNNLSQKGLSKLEVTLYSFSTNAKFALLLFFFSFTNVWKLYSRCFVFYIGFLQGILLSCCLFFKGFSGIFFYLALLVPHTFLLAPVYLFLLHQLENWHNQSFQGECSSSSDSDSLLPSKKKQNVIQILPLFFLSILLLLLGSFLEGYLNVPLLRLYHS